MQLNMRDEIESMLLEVMSELPYFNPVRPRLYTWDDLGHRKIFMAEFESDMDKARFIALMKMMMAWMKIKRYAFLSEAFYLEHQTGPDDKRNPQAILEEALGDHSSVSSHPGAREIVTASGYDDGDAYLAMVAIDKDRNPSSIEFKDDGRFAERDLMSTLLTENPPEAPKAVARMLQEKLEGFKKLRMRHLVELREKATQKERQA